MKKLHQCQYCQWESGVHEDVSVLDAQYEEHYLNYHMQYPILYEEGIDFTMDEDGIGVIYL